MAKHQNNLIPAASALLLIVAAAYFLYVAVFRSTVLTAQFDPARFKKAYEESQWMVPNSKMPISDTTLYAYAGYRYINGENPILISPEVPPAGKYLIGIFIFLFGNHELISFFSAVAVLLLIYGIVRMHSATMLPASLAVWLTALHPIFTDQLTTAPQLEIIQVMFLLLFLYLFLRYEKTRNIIFLIAASAGLGLFASTKLFLIFYPLALGWISLMYVVDPARRSRILRELPVIVAVSMLVYTATYLQLFILGASVRRFLGMHKWIYQFYADSSIDSSRLRGAYLSLIFFNQWKVWSTGYPTVTYQGWSLYWPLTAALGLISMTMLTVKKHPYALYLPAVLFVLTYGILLFFIPIFPRYLVLFFIPLHILTALYVDRLVRR